MNPYCDEDLGKCGAKPRSRGDEPLIFELIDTLFHKTPLTRG